MSLQMLTVKDIANVCNISESSARKLNKDIKEQYSLSTRITHEHLKRYLNL